MTSVRLQRLCQIFGSLFLLPVLLFGEGLPDYFCGLLEGASLALLLCSLALRRGLQAERRRKGGDHP